MAISTADFRDRVAGHLRRFGEWAKLHRFWFEAAGVTLLALAALGVIGGMALRRASAWSDQAARLRAVEAAGSRLLATFQPPDSAEVAAWSASERALRELTLVSGSPLATAGIVAERAEEVGILSTAVRLISNDTASVPGSFGSGSWSATTRETTIGVQLTDDLSALSRLIGALPPNVEVASVRLQPAGTLLRAELRLVARSLEGPS